MPSRGFPLRVPPQATEGSRPEDPGGGLRGAPGVRKANMGLQDMVLSSSEFNS